MITNHVFSAFAFISFIIVSVPLAWHLEAWNSGICLYIFWVATSNLTLFINSIIWDGNAVDWAPVWCDITTRVTIGTSVAIPATLLCIQRRIYHAILNPRAVVTSGAEKRRLVIVDLMIGLGLPILNIILAYVVQLKRYYIVEDIGCSPFIYIDALALVLIPLWPLVISLISCIYGCLNIRQLWIKRRMLSSLMDTSTGCISSTRYLRLLMLSGIDILITLPFYIWIFTTWFPLLPWGTWTEIHVDWSVIEVVPAAIWRNDRTAVVSIELTRWISVIYAIIFFIFFGFAEEARKHYRSTLQTVAETVRHQKISPLSSQPSGQYGNTRPMKYSRSSGRKSGSTTATAYSAEFDLESKHEVKSESSAPSPDSPISPPTIPRDFESTRAVETTQIEVV